MWNRASKTVSHEGADIEMDALDNGKPVKEVSDERRDMVELVRDLALVHRYFLIKGDIPLARLLN